MAKNEILISIEDQYPELAPAVKAISNLVAAIERNTDNIAAASDLAAEYVRVAQAQRVIDQLNKMLAAVENRLKTKTVPELFIAKKSGSIVALGYRVTPSSSVRISIIKDKKEEGFEWIRDHGHGDIIKTDPTIHPSTLEAWGRTMIEEGEDLPEEIFTQFFYDTTSLTKVAVKK